MWPHFSQKELQCPHCKEMHMDDGFMNKLESIRVSYGRPIYINSGYRCPEYNNRISHTGFDGPHTTGKAVDIGIVGEEAYKLLGIALEHGVKGIGINQKGSYSKRFIHLDDAPEATRPWVWTY